MHILVFKKSNHGQTAFLVILKRDSDRRVHERPRQNPQGWSLW